MFDLPELTVIAAQMNDVLPGLVVAAGTIGVSPHRFVWYDREPEEFAALTAGLRVGRAWAEGKWLFVPLEPGRVLLIGEWGGRIRYHADAADLPAKRHLDLTFTTGAALSATTQMWGGVHLVEAGREREVKYVKEMRPTPLDERFDRAYFGELVAAAGEDGRRSVKGLLTQEQLIPGLGNAIAQDIMARARLHPGVRSPRSTRCSWRGCTRRSRRRCAPSSPPAGAATSATCSATPAGTRASWTPGRWVAPASRAGRRSRRSATSAAPATSAPPARRSGRPEGLSQANCTERLERPSQ